MAEGYYNSLPDAREIDKVSVSPDGTANSSIASVSASASTTVPQAPASYDAGGVNVTEDAQSKAKTYEFKNLEGDLELVPYPKNLSILPGSTVKILGVGKWLSGSYYVMSRSAAISGSGPMTLRLKVVKTKFGDSLKGEKPIVIEREDLIGYNNNGDGSGDVYDSTTDEISSAVKGTNTNTASNPPPQSSSGGRTTYSYNN